LAILSPGMDRVSVAAQELGPDRYDELLDDLARGLAAPDLDRRMQLLVPVLDDHHLAAPRGLVQLLPHGLLLDYVHEAEIPGGIGHDGLRIGIPAEE